VKAIDTKCGEKNRFLTVYTSPVKGDNHVMNGIGIGTAVGLGTIIGLGIVHPGAEVMEYVATFAFYGFITGFLFEVYRFAFTYKAPFGPRR
jgi:hypothetical protein